MKNYSDPSIFALHVDTRNDVNNIANVVSNAASQICQTYLGKKVLTKKGCFTSEFKHEIGGIDNYNHVSVIFSVPYFKPEGFCNIWCDVKGKFQNSDISVEYVKQGFIIAQTYDGVLREVLRSTYFRTDYSVEEIERVKNRIALFKKEIAFSEKSIADFI
jgi:hypothetical protein